MKRPIVNSEEAVCSSSREWLTLSRRSGSRFVAAALVCLMASVVLAQQNPNPPRPPVTGPVLPANTLDLPDLLFTRFSSTGTVQFVEGGLLAVTITFSIKNGGRARSGPCRISASGATDSRKFPLALKVDRQSDPYYGSVGELNPGESRTLNGQILFDSSRQGSRVTVFLTVDSAAGDEFPTPGGRVREQNENNNYSSEWNFTLPFAPLSVAPRTAAPARQPSAAETWTIGLSGIEIRQMSEVSGDDPYFIVYAFRCQIGVDGSAQVWITDGFQEIVEDAGLRRRYPIPAYLNRATFENVRRIRSDEADAPEVLGLFIVAMDHDGSDWSDVRRLARRAIEPLRDELNRLIGRTRGIGSRSAEAIAEAVERVKELTTPTNKDIGLEIMEGLFLPWNLDSVDADDYIGVQRVVYLAVDQSVGLLFPGAERLRTLHPTWRYLGTRDNRTNWLVDGITTKGAVIVR